jgi:hypothetical protein
VLPSHEGGPVPATVQEAADSPGGAEQCRSSAGGGAAGGGGGGCMIIRAAGHGSGVAGGWL